jgi:hypothetical protein
MAIDKSPSPPSIEVRLDRLESEFRGLRKFVTTLETGHEARARSWSKQIAELSKEIAELKIGIRKTRKKFKKLRR